jgi:twitching motility protein PilT
MPASIDPFVDVLLREGGDQLYLLPDEPVTMVKDGKPRKVSRQPLTDKHIYALLVEVAPTESADQIDKMAETAFDYVADRGLVHVRVVPDMGRLTAVIAPGERTAAASAIAAIPGMRAPAKAGAAIASAPMPDSAIPPALRSAQRAEPAANAPPPPGLPADFGSPQFKVAERALGELLTLLVTSGSSDLHLRVGEPPIFRTHGEMKRQQAMPALTADQLEMTLLAIMSDRNRASWNETGDADFAYEIPALARFRVNAGRDRKGPISVFRVIPAQILSAEALEITKEVQALCYLTKGLVLVTGPTGSGKSTTLSGLIDLINRTRTDHIITIEDPIEFVHENKKCVITQRQVGLHTGSFKAALRAALREDPDIVLVGEMRDLETIAIAIETAETGHLVFGTLHTTTAASTVDRIIDQFPADRQSQIRVMLSESLRGVVCQTLCKKIGGGRVAAREILITTPAVSNLIRESKIFQIPSIMQTSKQLGMVTLNDALLELVEKKLIAPDEAYMRSVEKVGIIASLKAKGHKLTIGGV